LIDPPGSSRRQSEAVIAGSHRCRFVVALLILISMALEGCQSSKTGMPLDHALTLEIRTSVGLPPRSVDDVLELFGQQAPEAASCSEFGGPEDFARRMREIYDKAPTRVARVAGFRPGLDGDKRDVARDSAGIAFLRGEATNTVTFIHLALDAISASTAYEARLQDWVTMVNRYSELAFYLAYAGDLPAAERALGSSDAIRSDGLSPRRGARVTYDNPYDQAFSESQEARAQAAILRARGQLDRAAVKSRLAVQRVSRAHLIGQAQLPGSGIMESYVAIADSELAETLRVQGRLVEAESVVRQALARKPTWGNSTRILRAFLLLRLTEIISDQGRPADAETLARLALREYESVCLSVGSLASATARELLARSLLLRGHPEEALRAYEAIAASLDAEPGTLDLKYGGSLSWALAELLNGRREAAEKRLTVGFDRATRLVGKDHYNVREFEGVLALTRLAAGDQDGALHLFQRALPTLLRQSSYAEGEAVAGGARGWRLRLIIEGWLELLSDLRSRGRRLPDGTDPVAEAFRVMQVAAAGDVPRALAAASARGAAGNPELGNVIRREQDLSRSIAMLEVTLGRLALGGSSSAASGSETRTLLAKLGSARVLLREEIGRRFPAYKRLVDPEPLSVSETQAMLRADEAVIAVYAGTKRTWMWAVPARGTIAAAESALTRDDITAVVASIRRSLAPKGRRLADIPAFDVAAAHWLYRELLLPVEGGWRAAGVVLTAVNGPLGETPLSLLVTEATTQAATRPTLEEYREVKWLARTHAIAALPSLSSLRLLRASPAGRAGRLPFIGFGDPYFSVAQAQEAAAEGTAGSGRRSASLASEGSVAVRDVMISPDAAVKESKLAMLPRLPDTADEIREIAQALGANEQRDAVLGVPANEHTVKTSDLSRYRVVAFATHGLVPGDLDGLTQPALALTAPEVSKVEGDGLLTMDEILGLRLDADWVVLSACNTANGAGAGAEAFSGLGRAFFYAGARALLLTHWPVETSSARALTTGVFRRQAADPSLSRARALQQTVNALIDEGGIIDPKTGTMVFRYAHPIFWAPFALVGDSGAN
jgi:CHAT domain-containing protein/tetratricopeptide (TPR) repeat protein